MTNGIWLIMSGSYVEQELAAEFGLLPPAFLPLGTKRLYEYHVQALKAAGEIWLTVPANYNLLASDANRLQELSINVLAVPPELQLGEAIVYAVTLIGASARPVRIIHGDTLIGDLPLSEVDEIGVSEESDAYSWAEVVVQDRTISALRTVSAGVGRDQGYPVACGYFAFGDELELVRAITRARGDFIAGLTSYAAERPMTTRPTAEWLDFGHVRTFFSF